MFVALTGILLLSPVFLFIAIAIKIESPGSIIFRQERVGQWGIGFGLYKFRSMIEGASQVGPSLTKSGDPRVTNFGRFLRRYKLDELPQLANVICGHMSLVGPRPEVKKFVDIFWKDYEHILTVKPGITDYATLEFRDEEAVLAKYEDMEKGYIAEVLPRKIELYKKYLERIGFLEDLQVIIKTLWKISTPSKHI